MRATSLASFDAEAGSATWGRRSALERGMRNDHTRRERVRKSAEGNLSVLGAHSLEGLNLKIDRVRKEVVPAGPVIAAPSAMLGLQVPVEPRDHAVPVIELVGIAPLGLMVLLPDVLRVHDRFAEATQPDEYLLGEKTAPQRRRPRHG